MRNRWRILTNIPRHPYTNGHYIVWLLQDDLDIPVRIPMVVDHHMTSSYIEIPYHNLQNIETMVAMARIHHLVSRLQLYLNREEYCTSSIPEYSLHRVFLQETVGADYIVFSLFVSHRYIWQYTDSREPKSSIYHPLEALDSLGYQDSTPRLHQTLYSSTLHI